MELIYTRARTIGASFSISRKNENWKRGGKSYETSLNLIKTAGVISFSFSILNERTKKISAVEFDFQLQRQRVRAFEPSKNRYRACNRHALKPLSFGSLFGNSASRFRRLTSNARTSRNSTFCLRYTESSTFHFFSNLTLNCPWFHTYSTFDLEISSQFHVRFKFSPPFFVPIEQLQCEYSNILKNFINSSRSFNQSLK